LARLGGTDPRSLWTAGAAAVLVLAVLTLVLRARSRRRREGFALAAISETRSGTSHQLSSSTERVALHERVEGPIQLVQRPAPARFEERHIPDPESGRGAESAQDEAEPASKGPSWPFLHLLRERLVRWLAAERSQLLSSHHAGAEQVLELEERLTRIQNQFEARLRAREQRVSELEAELIAKEKAIADLEQALSGRSQRNL
jgi:hypothetical protein